MYKIGALIDEKLKSVLTQKCHIKNDTAVGSDIDNFCRSLDNQIIIKIHTFKNLKKSLLTVLYYMVRLG